LLDVNTGREVISEAGRATNLSVIRECDIDSSNAKLHHATSTSCKAFAVVLFHSPILADLHATEAFLPSSLARVSSKV